MIELDDLREKLKDRNLKMVAEGAGVHYNALYRLMNERARPSYETVKRLVQYLEAKA
jgi:DNA-binding phage protein